MHGTTDDAQFEESLRNFQELCDQLKEVESVMQEYLASLAALIETQAKLSGQPRWRRGGGGACVPPLAALRAGVMEATFVGQPFHHVSQQYSSTNRWTTL
jgi:hypothetical protein